jgi:hypothetical protein
MYLSYYFLDWSYMFFWCSVILFKHSTFLSVYYCATFKIIFALFLFLFPLNHLWIFLWVFFSLFWLIDEYILFSRTFRESFVFKIKERQGLMMDFFIYCTVFNYFSLHSSYFGEFFSEVTMRPKWCSIILKIPCLFDQNVHFLCGVDCKIYIKHYYTFQIS